MPKLAKPLLIGLAAATAAAALLLIGANAILKSQVSRGSIGRSVEKALRTPVEVGDISFTPWGGLHVEGFAARQFPPDAGHFAETGPWKARVRLAPLFRRKIVFAEIAVEAPNIRWIQNEKGRWALPKKAKRERPPESRPTPEPRPGTPPPQPAGTPAFTVEIRRLAFAGGSLDLLDRERKPVLAVTGIRAAAKDPTPDQAKADAAADAATVAGALRATDLRARLAYREGQFGVTDFTALVAGGTLAARGSVGLTEKSKPFRGEATLAGCDLGRLLSETDTAGWNAAGTLTGTFEFEGDSDSENLKGKGRIDLAGGSLRGFELLAALGQLTGIEEFVKLDLAEARTLFRVERERIHLDECLLRSDQIRIRVTGTIKFGGKLDLAAQLAFGPKLAKKLPAPVAARLAAGDDGFRTLDFDVGGRLSKPKSDLLDRLVKEIVGDNPLDLLRSILGSDREAP